MVFARYHLPVVIYAALIFVGSALPGLPSAIPLFDLRDKILHFLEFAGLGALLWRSIRLWSLKWRALPTWILAWGMGITYAASDEIHQLYVPGREGSTYDWLADIIGLAAGLSTAYIFYRNSRIIKNLPE